MSLYFVRKYTESVDFGSSMVTLMILIVPIYVAQTFSMMLKRSIERGRPCPVSDLSGKASSFSSMSMTAVDFF